MKTTTKSKNILAALIAIITAGSVSAETIYITGATAFRGAANSVIDAYALASQGGQQIWRVLPLTRTRSLAPSTAFGSSETEIISRLTGLGLKQVSSPSRDHPR